MVALESFSLLENPKFSGMSVHLALIAPPSDKMEMKRCLCWMLLMPSFILVPSVLVQDGSMVGFWGSEV